VFGLRGLEEVMMLCSTGEHGRRFEMVWMMAFRVEMGWRG
jgi:hypothetical protein